MFSICLVIENKEPEWYNQWGYVLSHWKPSELYVIGDEVNTAYKAFRNAITVQTAEDITSGPLVLFQPITAKEIQPTQSVISFQHPSSCVYMFGADHTIFTASFLGLRAPEHIVYIPTEGDTEMFSWTAGAVAMYDRKVKNG